MRPDSTSSGPHPRQYLDIFLPEAPVQSAPVVVYIHGGWWYFLSKEDNSLRTRPVSAHVLRNEHHFQTMLTMGDPHSALTATFLQWIRRR